MSAEDVSDFKYMNKTQSRVRGHTQTNPTWTITVKHQILMSGYSGTGKSI